MGDLLLDAADFVVRTLAVVARYADELQLREALHVLRRHRAAQQVLERFEAPVHRGVSLLAAAAPLDQLVELVLDEDAFERGGMPRFVQLVETDLQLAAQQVSGVLGRAAQDFAHAQEVGLLVADDARIGRNGDFAVGECVERVDGLVARLVAGHVYDDLDLLGRVVVHAADLDLALLVGADDRLLDRLGGRRVGYFGDGERAFVNLRDARAHLHRPAPQSVVVAAHVRQAPRGEVGPTAMPSEPWASSSGNLTGSVTGSSLRPS